MSTYPLSIGPIESNGILYPVETADVPTTPFQCLYFTRNGSPVLGLSPIITVYKSINSNTNITPVPTITEIGSGYYKFTYSVVTPTIVQVDSGDNTMNYSDRYKSLRVGPYDNYTVDYSLSEVHSDLATVGTNVIAIQTVLTAIKGTGWTTETLKAIKDAVDLKLATLAYTAPDNASITAIRNKTDLIQLTSGNDVKATLDGETVDLTPGTNAKSGIMGQI